MLRILGIIIIKIKVSRVRKELRLAEKISEEWDRQFEQRHRMGVVLFVGNSKTIKLIGAGFILA